MNTAIQTAVSKRSSGHFDEREIVSDTTTNDSDKCPIDSVQRQIDFRRQPIEIDGART